MSNTLFGQVEEFRFVCPKCQATLSCHPEAAGQMFECPACSHAFVPDPYAPQPKPKSPAENLRQQATNRMTCAWRLLVLGGIAGLCGFAPRAEPGACMTSILVGSSCEFWAFALFLFSHILRLRADLLDIR